MTKWFKFKKSSDLNKNITLNLDLSGEYTIYSNEAKTLFHQHMSTKKSHIINDKVTGIIDSYSKNGVIMPYNFIYEYVLLDSYHKFRKEHFFKMYKAVRLQKKKTIGKLCTGKYAKVCGELFYLMAKITNKTSHHILTDIHYYCHTAIEPFPDAPKTTFLTVPQITETNKSKPSTHKKSKPTPPKSTTRKENQQPEKTKKSKKS